MNRIATHPQLRMSEDLKNFLQADEEVWAMERARSAEGSVFKKKPSDFMQMFKVMSRHLPILGGIDQ
jgi:sorting nexin-1/2